MRNIFNWFKKTNSEIDYDLICSKLAEQITPDLISKVELKSNDILVIPIGIRKENTSIRKQQEQLAKLAAAYCNAIPIEIRKRVVFFPHSDTSRYYYPTIINIEKD